MSSKRKKLTAQKPEGKTQGFDGTRHEPESKGADHRLSDIEREAISQGIDAAKVGSFAPEEEMDEFYRLHRGD
jgi:hypothetical protein